ncbi:MAG: tRNA lysidine(34) synthetase TilS [Alphaproteobacteria bacterium]|nr:tRNA lysidine(34) synthetase TilS [Alphaproteobacteria bacterium]
MRATQISSKEFADQLDQLGYPLTVAPVVACSGGPDSIALAILADEWAQARGMRAQALCVDHGLRPEAAAEASGVAAALKGYGISTTVLRHEGAKPVRDIQAAARLIRFRLLTDWVQASELAYKHIFLAHHLDDQAETVLLRLARGSGIDGLAAMAPVTERDGITLLRPLLSFPKARLVATAAESGLPVVTDPSNGDRGFARVRMRQMQDVLAAEGLTPERLSRTAERMARARDALTRIRDKYLKDYAQCNSAGFVACDVAQLCDLPEEIALRCLSHMLRILGGNDYPPREERIIALHRALAQDSVDLTGLQGGRTMSGVRAMPWQGRLLLCRESAGMTGTLAISERTLWDNRYDCRFDAQAVARSGFTIGPLGRSGLAWARERAPQALAALPGPVRVTVPALRQGDDLTAVPHLGVGAEAAMSQDYPIGTIGYRSVSPAWGEAFRQRLSFSL